jgi:hypothetical protein
MNNLEATFLEAELSKLGEESEICVLFNVPGIGRKSTESAEKTSTP